MEKAISALIIKREDVKQLMLSEIERLKEIGIESGIFDKENPAIALDASGGMMGIMAKLPEFLGKLAPFKEALPHIAQVASLHLEYTEILEQQVDTVSMYFIKVAAHENS